MVCYFSMKTKLSRLLVAVMLPTSVGQWTPIPIKSTLPKVVGTDSSWQVTTNNSAGGFFYKLTAPAEGDFSKISWKWRVDKFPTVTPKAPFTKDTDDYALRVGVVFSNHKKNIKLHSEIEKAVGSEAKVSYVVFYNASSLASSECVCEKSPYNDYILNCQIPVQKEFSNVERSPVVDLIKGFKVGAEESKKIRVVGIWIFADSDNSHSESEAYLANLRVE